MLIPAQADGVVTAQGRSVALPGRIPRQAWIVVGLTALAAVLRFMSLGSQSFWFDEAQAAHEFGGSLGALLHAIGRQETSPPLYFLLGWAWGHVFGTGEVALRSLSALAGVAVVPLLYGAGRELVAPRAGVAAAALAAISPFMIWYSQEAREYMLLAALCAASLLFFARARRAPTAGNLAGWAVCSALALLTHFFAGFLVFPEAALLLLAARVRAPARARAVLVAVALPVLVEAALVPLAVSDTAHPLGWVSAFALSVRVQQVPVAFALSTLYQSGIVDYGLAGAGVVVAVVVLLLLAGVEGRALRGALIAGGLAAFVLLVPLLLALLGRDYYVPRVLMPAWLPLAVLIGAATAAARPRGVGVALLVALAAMFVYGQIRITREARFQRPDWRGVAAALGRSSDARAVVAEAGGLATDPLKLYLPRAVWSPSPAPLRVGELDVVGSPLQSVPARLPAGVRLLSRRLAGGFLVLRFVSGAGWVGTPATLAAQAASLVHPASGDPAAVIQDA
jgi:uncharacterized membrane protein